VLKKWLREPLLHFLLIGAALFIVYGMQNNQPVDGVDRIVISSAEIDRLVTRWEKQWQRMPTQTELDGMIQALIREEVLYREALAMGLDQNDSIVRRRLAQKVEFIFSDIAALAEPSDTELTDYLANHPDRFEIPSRLSFTQIYLNSDKRGKQAMNDAEALLGSLTQNKSSVDVFSAGDPFMFGTEQAVARLFGKDFSHTLFTLQTDGWQGPIQSGYGLHLVQINDRSPAIQPDLNAIREKVLNEWHADQRRKLNDDFYQNLRSRYELVIEQTGKSNDLVNNTVSKAKP